MKDLLWAVGGIATIAGVGYVATLPQSVDSISSLESDYGRLGPDKDCSDFSSQNEAQTFFDANRSHNPSTDPYHLDRDNDGIACETLP